MTQLDSAGQDVAALETAPTRYIEGHGIFLDAQPAAA
jgi:hypothetical protein